MAAFNIDISPIIYFILFELVEELQEAGPDFVLESVGENLKWADERNLSGAEILVYNLMDSSQYAPLLALHIIRIGEFVCLC